MRNKARHTFLLGMISVVVSNSNVGLADTLSLDQFVDQVKSKNDGYKASSSIGRSAKGRSEEGDLLTMPQLDGNYQHLVDQKPTTQPGFAPSATTADLYSLGISERTGFGLSAKLSYNFTYTSLEGVNPTFFPFSQYYTGRPMLELSQSLLKNGFGSEVRAQEKLINASALATSYAETFKSKNIILDARIAYWKLAVAQRVLDAQKVFLEYAKRTQDWSSRRVKLQLADRADLLQAEAAYQLRNYNLQKAETDLTNAARYFNSLRGIDSSTVTEKLSDIELPQEGIVVPQNPMRDDVLAAEQSAKIAAANSDLSIEKNKPMLDVYGSYALNSLGRDMQATEQASFIAGAGPTTVVGVKFATPLDFALVSRTNDAYRSEKAAAETSFQRKLVDQKRDFDELTFKIAESQRQMELLKKLELAQNEKLKNERQRLFKGRTTTYQVTLFEQDAEETQLNRIRAQGELLILLAQLELYKGGDQ